MKKRTKAFDDIKNHSSVPREESARKKSERKRGILEPLLLTICVFLCAFIFLQWKGFFPNHNKEAVAEPNYKKTVTTQHTKKARKIDRESIQTDKEQLQ